MEISNLTLEQVEMLDMIWSFDTRTELEEFRSQLPLFRRQQIDTLIELMHLQHIDDQVADLDDHELLIAKLMLAQYM